MLDLLIAIMAVSVARIVNRNSPPVKLPAALKLIAVRSDVVPVKATRTAFAGPRNFLLQ